MSNDSQPPTPPSAQALALELTRKLWPLWAHSPRGDEMLNARAKTIAPYFSTLLRERDELKAKSDKDAARIKKLEEIFDRNSALDKQHTEWVENLKASLARVEGERDGAKQKLQEWHDVYDKTLEDASQNIALIATLRAELAVKGDALEGALDHCKSGVVTIDLAQRAGLMWLDEQTKLWADSTRNKITEIESSLSARAGQKEQLDVLIATAPPALPADLAALAKLGNPFAFSLTEKQAIENLNRAHAAMKSSTRAGHKAGGK